ncbi:MAG: MBL fold metallo-hydrolase [Acidobacteria bacterium]|nr:MAG: MBL fold metallo-hydrolase [Acidobacteriota bacterium]PYQ67021.1 MAG: MBL fold metallo-hydrolase [Acidobacteriota bacterium]
MRLGSLELDIVRGSGFRLDGGAMFGIVPKVLWEKKFPADERNRIRLATNCLLVRGGGYTALVESGLGEKWDSKSREIYAIDGARTIEDSLAEKGVPPGDVDALVLSHLHFDHAGGSTRREDGRAAPAFPNATVYVQSEELSHARSPNERDRASYRREDWEPCADAGLLAEVSGEVEVRPGLTVVPVRGHNAGMQAIRIDSGGRTAFYFADALPTTAHVAIPWIMGYDLYPVDLIENKRRLVAQAVAEKWLCIFEHDPEVPWGTIVEDEEGKRLVEAASV